MTDAPASAEAKSNSSAIFDLGWLVFFSRTKVDYKQTKKKCVHGSAMDFGFWASVRAENEINKTISNINFIISFHVATNREISKLVHSKRTFWKVLI